MGRNALPVATLAVGLAACNILSGASELSVCEDCAGDAATAPAAVADGSIDRGDAGDAGDVVDGGLDSGPADADAAPPIGCQGATSCERVVFVTSLSYQGDLGGVAGADAKCQATADQAGLASIKGRTFVAWVSTTQTSPALRFAQGTRAYVGATGMLIAADWQDLTNGGLAGGIDLDENGVKRGDGAWTGTKSAGATFAGDSCLDWTAKEFLAGGARGNVGGSGAGWSSGATDPCGLFHRLYCFEK